MGLDIIPAQLAHLEQGATAMTKNLDNKEVQREAVKFLVKYEGITSNIYSLKEQVDDGGEYVKGHQNQGANAGISQERARRRKIVEEMKNEFGVNTVEELRDKLRAKGVEIPKPTHPFQGNLPQQQPEQDKTRNNFWEKSYATIEAKKEEAAAGKKREYIREDSERYKAQNAESEASFQRMQNVNSQMEQSKRDLMEVKGNSPQNQAVQASDSQSKVKHKLNEERVQSSKTGGYEPPKRGLGSSQPMQRSHDKKHGREM